MNDRTKILTLCILFICHSACILPSIASPSSIIYVDDDGDEDFISIQDAIDHANINDTIIVYSGTYNEQIVIDKPLFLQGEIDTNQPNNKLPIIIGSQNSTAITINSDSVSVSRFTIQDVKKGIYITETKVNISQCNFTNIFDSCYLINSSYCMIEQCNFDTGSVGIYLYNSHLNLFSKNKISNNHRGIYIEESFKNHIEFNTIFDNEQGIFSSYAPDNIIEKNNFLNNIEQAKFAKFFSKGFLIPNKWIGNYWDDAEFVVIKIIPGLMYIPNKDLMGWFVPWIEVDWNPSRNPI